MESVLSDLMGFSIAALVLSIITLIVFFVMASRIGKIRNSLDYFQALAMADPQNWKNMKCSACSHEFRSSKALKYVSCPKCNSNNVKSV